MNGDSLLSFGPNAGYLAELYQLYLSDPSLVDPTWAEFFKGLDGSNAAPAVNGHANGHTNGHAKLAVRGQATGVSAEAKESSLNAVADKLVDGYRRYGHLKARLSPLVEGGVAPESPVDLTPAHYGESRNPASVPLNGYSFAGARYASLLELHRDVEAIYCSSIGYEYEHLTRHEEREWLRQRIEGRNAMPFVGDVELRKGILRELVRADLFESELHRKYVGTKRFSLEGNDTLIPVLRSVIQDAAKGGIQEIVYGMAHRGRLNVLTNIVGKPLELLFAEFEDQTQATVLGAGDVKYHLGWDNCFVVDGASVGVKMVPNPSHLEFVNPVVEGIARALQDYRYDRNRTRVLPVAMHGDAAFAGQGIVFETINFSGIDGYATGGTLHLVINNQIGFTTTPDESRSTRYCTDLAKGIDSPIFHVNCEDPEAACWVTALAVEYRNTFGKDVFVDLIGHRKHGHNEGDDPSFTQPLTYSEVKGKRPIWQQYGERLLSEGVVTQEVIDSMVAQYKQEFAAAHERMVPAVQGEASPIYGKVVSMPSETAVSADTLKMIAHALTEYPEGFVPHPKLGKIIEKRVETVDSGEGIEWGVAELLAFGSLVLEGRSVRLSGQDCRRGTFSQRHSVLDGYDKPGVFSPLEELASRQSGAGRFEVFNSPLSEAGVLGFEFGYSATAPDALVIWEAQFGDFSNGAQVIIDQFITSSESKWAQMSGVTLMLPHAYEGQGPEHSSARLERYLQMCAEGNMTVCYPSSAAQHFHLMRRQGLSTMKRPLVVMTPKSLLRLPAATSALSEFTSGGFKTVVETDFAGGKKADHLVLVTGKVYYDVAAALAAAGKCSARVIRVEQLYPFPEAELQAVLKASKAKTVTWVQEEPQNMGAWSYVSPLIEQSLGIKPTYIGRPGSAATATGSAKRHAFEQKTIMAALVERVKG
jgi:2-oxoglutarate dehydrogenase E1 component